MNDAREAPSKDHPTGMLKMAELVGAGAGVGEKASSAITALMEAAAKRTAQATFFISICGSGRYRQKSPNEIMIDKKL